MTSTLAPIPAGLFSYNANDQFMVGDAYDANGNTTSSGGISNVYDFENHLIQKGGVSIVYDGDGNRVQKTVAGVTTTYLVDTLNPTGYAQVIGESFSTSSAPNGEVSHNYVYGLELISQTRKFNVSGNQTTQQIFYAYDGHGSVRALTNTSGAVTDTYDYDSFGNLIHSTGSTPNNYLFVGEQFDPDLGLYYNRARYLNTSTGRFWTMDEYEGFDEDPETLHKYLYAAAEPVDASDPTGRLSNTIYGNIVHEIIEGDFVDYLEATNQRGIVEENISGILGRYVPLGLGGLIPDMINLTTKEIYDIKSTTSAAAGAAKIGLYLYALNRFDKRKTKWQGGTTFRPRSVIRLSPVTLALVSPPILGLITYEVVDTFEIYFLARLVAEDFVAGLSLDFGTGLALAAEGAP